MKFFVLCTAHRLRGVQIGEIFTISRGRDNRYWLLFFQIPGRNQDGGSRSRRWASSRKPRTCREQWFHLKFRGCNVKINVERSALPQRYAHDVASAGVSPLTGVHQCAEGCPAEGDVTRALLGEIRERSGSTLSTVETAHAWKCISKIELYYDIS
jgi:hypothetical protein